MPVAAPRLSPRLVAEIEALTATELTIAEISRRVGAVAEREQLPRPSYEQVRVHVHDTVRRYGARRCDCAVLDVRIVVRVPRVIVGRSLRNVARRIRERRRAE